MSINIMNTGNLLIGIKDLYFSSIKFDMSLLLTYLLLTYKY